MGGYGVERGEPSARVASRAGRRLGDSCRAVRPMARFAFVLQGVVRPSGLVRVTRSARRLGEAIAAVRLVTTGARLVPLRGARLLFCVTARACQRCLWRV